MEFTIDIAEVGTKLLVDNKKAVELLQKARKTPGLKVNYYLIKLLERGGNDAKKPSCRSAFYAATVMPDGHMVMPCVHYPVLKAHLGNGDNLEEIWHSGKAREVRRNCGRYPFCGGCMIACLVGGSQLATPRNLRETF